MTDRLPVLRINGVCLREVAIGDTDDLALLRAMPSVSGQLPEVPVNTRKLKKWIVEERMRNVEGESACFTVSASDRTLVGLFTANRLWDVQRAQIGFGISPQLWSSPLFVHASRAYLAFLFQHWYIRGVACKTFERKGPCAEAVSSLGARLMMPQPRQGIHEYYWQIERPSWCLRLSMAPGVDRQIRASPVYALES